MKKFIGLFLFVLLVTSTAVAEDIIDYSEYCPKSGNFNFSVNDKLAVKNVMKKAGAAANNQNVDKLYNLYAENYTSMDGFSRDIYFDLVKKTCEKYPDIKHKYNIKKIYVNGTKAIVNVEEIAVAKTFEEIDKQRIQGNLYSVANVTYYLEKIRDEWKFVSDYITFEQTKLMYGEAIKACVDFITPVQNPANTEYSALLKVIPPSKSFVLGSITQESITYPQISSEEVFKKIPADGILERVFIANTKNLNEYNIASIGLTRVNYKNNVSTVYVTGLGYIINRVNIKPVNNYIKVLNNDEKTKK